MKEGQIGSRPHSAQPQVLATSNVATKISVSFDAFLHIYFLIDLSLFVPLISRLLGSLFFNLGILSQVSLLKGPDPRDPAKLILALKRRERYDILDIVTNHSPIAYFYNHSSSQLILELTYKPFAQAGPLAHS
jgi:hypothetical protein